MAADTITTLNMDMPGLYARLQRFITEVWKSQSSNIMEVLVKDQNRLQSYLNALRKYHDWMKSQPESDVPKGSPMGFALEAPIDIDYNTIESESVADVCRMLIVLRNEMINSNSSRRPSGIEKFDSERFVEIVDRVDRFLNDYIKQVDPLDLPESAPQEPLTPAGHTGV